MRYRARTYDPPEDDLPSATGSTQSNIDSLQGDLPGTGSTRSDHGRDGTPGEATSPAKEDSPDLLAVDDPLEEEAPLAKDTAPDVDDDLTGG